jgi:anti-anti-sigma factor
MRANSETLSPSLNVPLSESAFKTANDDRQANQPISTKSWSPKAVFTNALIISASRYDATIRQCATIVLHPKGRIDQNSAPIFRAWLTDAIHDGAGAVIVDFTGVDYINSAALRALMAALKKAQAAQIWFGVSNLRPTVNEVFEISRCNRALPIFGAVQRRSETAQYAPDNLRFLCSTPVSPEVGNGSKSPSAGTA